MESRNFLAACPTILIRSDGMPFVLSTSLLGRNPVARLLDETNGQEKAGLQLEAGSLLGGVYAFLDNQDRLVMVDGRQRLVRLKAIRTVTDEDEDWELIIDESVDLSSAVTGPCGGDDCDAVVSISPGVEGTVWFVTQGSVVGVYNPEAATWEDPISWFKLGEEERIDNSFSTTPDGRAAIVTNKAFYLLAQDSVNQPFIVWRHEYDYGSARKPGQLSHGSGATPTFFGDDDEYVMITDNADEVISLVVRDAIVRGPDEEQGRLICRKPIFSPLVNSGTENSAIGLGRTAVIASTYGYPYPALPEGADPSVPARADFVGGMVRVDIPDESDGQGFNSQGGGAPCDCEVRWVNGVRSAAVPKLSTATVELLADGQAVNDRLIYTVERRSPDGGQGTTGLDSYYYTAVRLETGEVVKQGKIGSGYLADTLQMAGNIGRDGVYWQGTISGVVRIAPR